MKIRNVKRLLVIFSTSAPACVLDFEQPGGNLCVGLGLSSPGKVVGFNIQVFVQKALLL